MTKYLRLALVFTWNSALPENFKVYFSRVFAGINKIFILPIKMGSELSFYEL